MITLVITYWNGRTERATGTEAKIERLFETLSGMRTVRSLVMEG